MRRIIVKAAIPAVAAVAALGVGTGVANAAVSPASASGCTFGSSSGNTDTCFAISGRSVHVNSMTTSATTEIVGRTLDVCITGPAGALPLCSGFHFVPKGTPLSITWAPNANEPVGTYCGVTFRLNADHTETRIGTKCFKVTA